VVADAVDTVGVSPYVRKPPNLEAPSTKCKVRWRGTLAPDSAPCTGLQCTRGTSAACQSSPLPLRLPFSVMEG
jgi:hypothetical protein